MKGKILHTHKGVECVQNPQERKTGLFASFFQSKKNKKIIDEDIYRQIKEVMEYLDIARRNYNYAKDRDLIDMYTYKIKASEAHYKHLLNILKNKTI